jgi:hypothetical protein
MMPRHVGNRRTDLMLLCLICVVFPVLCPIPLGKSRFFRVYVRPVPPWEIGAGRDHANLGGSCVTSASLTLGPVSFTREAWAY